MATVLYCLLGTVYFIMCLILFNQPKLDWVKVKNAREFIGKNLFDFEEFKPLIDMVLSDRLKELEDYCKRSKKDYPTKLKQMCEINEYEIGYYTMILPSFMNRIDIQEQNQYYKKWCELVGTLNCA